MSKIHSRKHNRTAQLLMLAASLPVVSAHAAPEPIKQENALPQINVKASKELPTNKKDNLSAAKFTQALVDTTQTVAVIPEAVLKEQNATTLTEALRNVPGVGAFAIGENGRMNTGDAISMRGFDVANSIFVDGVRDLGNVTRDVFNTDAVEVFKGAAGTDNGRTAASGSINLTTKQPEARDFNKASLGFGSDNYYRATVDANKQINDTTAIRLNAMGESADGIGRDGVENKKWAIAPSIAFGLGTDLRVYLNYLHIEQDNLIDGGTSTVGLNGFDAGKITKTVNDVKVPAFTDSQVAYLNRTPVDRATYYGSSSDFDDVQADMATARIEYDVNDSVKVINTSRWGKTEHQYLATIPMSLSLPDGVTDPALTVVSRSGNNGDTSNEVITNQTNVVSGFNTGSLAHDLTVGAEFTREKMSTYGWDATAQSTSLYQPDTSLSTSLTSNPGYNDGTMDTYSAYLFDTIHLSPKFAINGGIRLDHYELKTSGIVNTAGRGEPAVWENSAADDSGDLFNWKVGALFKPTENGSLYANYAVQQQTPGTITGGDGVGNGNVFAPSTSDTSNNNLSLDPQESNTIEVGTKWELMDKRLLLTGALFQTELTNELEKDATSGIYYQTGKKRVKGVEVGAVGEITDNLQVTAGYTYQESEIDNITNTADRTSADGSADIPFTPSDSFTLWSTYKIDKFSLGSGARYMGEMKKASDGNQAGPAVVPAYWVFDAMASYQATKNVGIQFNIGNLLDKNYISSINRGGWRYVPGAERNYRLAFNFDF